MKSNASPTLLLVEIPSANEAPALLDQLADVCDPSTKVITIGSVNEYSFYCWLMDIGIFSYLLKPLTVQVLESTYNKSTETAASQASQGKQPGKVIAVMGARGGVGATTIGLNLAGIVAEQSGKPVALVDIDPQEGSVALALDIEPSRGVREALERPDRIDSLFIERVMTKPTKNLSVLSVEESLQETLIINDQAADVLIKELRDKFSVVVLDIPRHLTAFSKQCLKQVDAIVLVAELTLLSLRDTIRLADMIREQLKMKPPIIVANRMGFSSGHEMEIVDFEKGADSKVLYRVPFTPDVFMQVTGEIPATKHKSHAAVKSIYALAAQLLPEAKIKTESAKKGPFDVLTKLDFGSKQKKKK